MLGRSENLFGVEMIIGASTCRAARGLLDWTQAELAQAAQVSLSALKNFEAGRSFPATETLRALQRALEAAEVEFLPDGAVRLRPDPITFGADYLVDGDRFRLLASRRDREIVVDISRETLEDAARLVGASRAVRHASFAAQRAEFQACAEDLLRSQAPEVRRVTIDNETFTDWRWRRSQIAGSINDQGKTR
jgi:transcriptional regulator with XRE-family HTH domain